MRRSTFAVAVVAALAGIGVRLAMAQPVDPLNPRVKALVATQRVNAPTGNFTFIDAGVGIVGACTFNGGASVCTSDNATTGGFTFVDAGSGIVGGVSMNNGNAQLTRVDATTVQANYFDGGIVDAKLGFREMEAVPSIASYLSGAGSGSFALYTSDLWGFAGCGGACGAGYANGTLAFTWTNQVFGTGSGNSFNLGSDLKMTSGGTLRLTDQDAAPTLTGGCTAPTVTWANGSALFQVDVGSTCAGISTIVLTFGTATDGWECKCSNTTAPGTRVIDSSAWSTTTVTITNYSRTLGTAADFTDGTDIRCMCRGG